MADEFVPKGPGRGDEFVPKGPGRGAAAAAPGGGPNAVAEDVFRRVSGLGGFLVVAFVAPMAAVDQSSNGAAAMEGALSALAGEAKEANRELAALLAASIREQLKKPR
jgi:hypothetical protein